MAYMDQAKKEIINTALKAIMPNGWSYSLKVNDSVEIICTIKKNTVDLLGLNGGRNHVNQNCLNRYFDGYALEVMNNIVAALNIGNYDNSDSQTDYFDVGHYIGIRIAG